MKIKFIFLHVFPFLELYGTTIGTAEVSRLRRSFFKLSFAIFKTIYNLCCVIYHMKKVSETGEQLMSIKKNATFGDAGRLF